MSASRTHTRGLPVAFRTWPLDAYVEPPHVSVEGRASDVVVTGTYMVPCKPCYRLSARAEMADRALRVDVIATTSSRATLGMVGPTGYEATVGDLPPGTYHVVVAHVIEATYDTLPSRRTNVLDTLVQVR